VRLGGIEIDAVSSGEGVVLGLVVKNERAIDHIKKLMALVEVLLGLLLRTSHAARSLMKMPMGCQQMRPVYLIVIGS
jgi:hypothetical protein